MIPICQQKKERKRKQRKKRIFSRTKVARAAWFAAMKAPGTLRAVARTQLTQTVGRGGERAGTLSESVPVAPRGGAQRRPAPGERCYLVGSREKLGELSVLFKVTCEYAHDIINSYI